MTYAALTFHTDDPDQREMLIALLADAGFDSFEETETDVIAYIAEAQFEGGLAPEIATWCDQQHIIWTRGQLPDQNWNEIWESSFQPVVVEDFCGIRASFHPPLPNVIHELVIDPKMAFGTGHHATTWIMIKAMRWLDLSGKSVLDLGCGTGILSILAAKLGAGPILAIDHEEPAVENTRNNLIINHTEQVEVQLGDENLLKNASFDIILANINKNAILGLLEQVPEWLAAGGKVLFSGLLKNDRNAILAVTNSLSLRLENEMERDSWIMLQFC